MTLSRDEIDEFSESMARAAGRDSQHVGRSTLSLAPTTRTGSDWQPISDWAATTNTCSLGRVFLQKIPGGEGSDLHRHVHESVHFVRYGSGWSEIGDQRVRWSAGDFVYTPPWIWHRHYADEGPDVEMIVIENSRLLAALDATQRESMGNTSFADAFGEQ